MSSIQLQEIWWPPLKLWTTPSPMVTHSFSHLSRHPIEGHSKIYDFTATSGLSSYHKRHVFCEYSGELIKSVKKKSVCVCACMIECINRNVCMFAGKCISVSAFQDYFCCLLFCFLFMSFLILCYRFFLYTKNSSKSSRMYALFYLSLLYKNYQINWYLRLQFFWFNIVFKTFYFYF